MPVLYLTVGLPGAGKTTWAHRVAAAQRILRLSPDDWMAPLFGESDPDGRRDIMEGRMIWVAHEVLRSGASVILDFGCWSPDERYAIRSMAAGVPASFRLAYLAVAECERRERADRRGREAPETTFAMTAEDHDRYLASWQAPTPSELAYGAIPPPPQGWENWPEWASDRWPTLPRLDSHAPRTGEKHTRRAEHD